MDQNLWLSGAKHSNYKIITQRILWILWKRDTDSSKWEINSFIRSFIHPINSNIKPDANWIISQQFFFCSSRVCHNFIRFRILSMVWISLTTHKSYHLMIVAWFGSNAIDDDPRKFFILSIYLFLLSHPSPVI